MRGSLRDEDVQLEDFFPCHDRDTWMGSLGTLLSIYGDIRRHVVDERIITMDHYDESFYRVTGGVR